MSLAALVDTDQSESPVTVERLRSLARRNGFTIPPQHEASWLLGLRSSYFIATYVSSLPVYIDPSLAPVPTKDQIRVYGRPDPQSNALNAWCHTTSLQAREPMSDLLKDRGVVAKDTIAVAGVPQTLGTLPQFISRSKEYPCSTIDAPVVQRLLLAGATLKGTSTCENYSLSPMSYTSAFGPVHNPWQHGYNSGGSSSGSAALVGLSMARLSGQEGLEHLGPAVDLALGGDQAGSIRLPASFCGIYGLKPSFGLIPYTGIAGLSAMIDHVGPLATTIEDIALLLSVTAGYDGIDPRMSPESPLRDNVVSYHDELVKFTRNFSLEQHRGLHRPILRVGLISESFTVFGMSQEVASVVHCSATKYFSAVGAQVSTISIPLHLDGPAIWTAAVRNQMASSAFGGRAGEMLTHDLPHLAPRWPLGQEVYDHLSTHNPAVILTALGESLLTDCDMLPLSAQRTAHRQALQLRAVYDKALEEVDVLITPTGLTAAPPLPKLDNGHEASSSIENLLRLSAGSTNNTSPFNITGHPALNVPCGWATTPDGLHKLPVGMQIIGKRFGDFEVLKAAKISSWEEDSWDLGLDEGAATRASARKLQTPGMALLKRNEHAMYLFEVSSSLALFTHRWSNIKALKVFSVVHLR
ncbi:Amidase [Cyphellophora attinorum]|uniref:Amidase n=1 Tax=Cyphellophora attinorum TaxID=1664694 RepID=A0A0N1H3E6_9EURO|nr:Amidase [Phialophora attinorum]KPI35363.1 Amidase [Phialophora attinorum]